MCDGVESKHDIGASGLSSEVVREEGVSIVDEQHDGTFHSVGPEKGADGLVTL